MPVRRGEIGHSLSASGHFRPIQRALMSGYPPEADIGTAVIYEYTPLAIDKLHVGGHLTTLARVNPQ
jgi:hypothetical protein